MEVQHLELTDKLPLSCSRKGTCCFGKQVVLNPWEIATLSETKGMSVDEFTTQYCELGGIKLGFDGKTMFNGNNSCNLYVDGFGCSLHSGRPLACRLYPIGRQLQRNQIRYIYEGQAFPCLKDCPEVNQLPFMSVEAYLIDQQVAEFEKAQDLYLELVQEIADIAFALILDSGLNITQRKEGIENWSKVNESAIQDLVTQLDSKWLSWVVKPNIASRKDPEYYLSEHRVFIQTHLQQNIAICSSPEQFITASTNAFSAALVLAYSLGVDYKELGKHWVNTARELNIPQTVKD